MAQSTMGALISEVADTFAVRSVFGPHLRSSAQCHPVPRRYGRVKAKPPSAVRFAQP
jgi:hypothetical protein